jgi:hypothetical protein
VGEISDRDKIRRFRDRAEEFRVRSAERHEPDARARLIQVADSYERMADFLQQGLADGVLSDAATGPSGSAPSSTP